MDALPELNGLNSFQRRRAYGDYVRRRNQHMVHVIPPPPPPPPVQHSPKLHGGLTLKVLRLTSEITLCEKEKKQDDESICVVCQDTPENNAIMRVLLCGHKYHIHCIEEWLEENVTCPLCKINLYEAVCSI